MRRILAMLLVGWFSFALICPAVLASGFDSGLPACCRNNGKHHCGAMSSQDSSPAGPALYSARCSLFPNGNSAPAIRVFTAPAPGAATLAVTGCSRIEKRSLPVHESAYDREAHKRGPPSFLL
jgi:hypothetical protein